MWFSGKAQYAGKGVGLPGKYCNAAGEPHGDALWVSLSAFMAVLRLLARETAIPCEACLALNADKLTASAVITLKEYWRV